MRAGQHPLKKTGDTLPPPPEVTIAMVTFIPMQSGYFAQSFDVLRLSLESLWQNTEPPYDLMIFDNGSCAEVRAYLTEQADKGRIQYLVLSDRNVGLPGAWNVLFRAAPGKYIAYADSDIYFYPGWLPACLEVLQTYPNVGMVTGVAWRYWLQFSTATLAWAESLPAEVSTRRGHVQDWEIYWTHARSLGWTEEQTRQHYAETEDIVLEYKGVTAFLGAGHFQFLTTREAIQAVAPFPHVMPMGNEIYLDETLNEKGFLRLSLPGRYVRHIGNRFDPADFPQHFGEKALSKRPSPSTYPAWWVKILDFPLVKRPLLFLNNQIFKAYYLRRRP